DGIRDFHVTGVQTCALPILEVADLGSKNGTFVNGRRVERASLRDGDELRFGEAVVRVQWVGRVGPLVADDAPGPKVARPPELSEIGRASCREGGENWRGGGG